MNDRDTSIQTIRDTVLSFQNARGWTVWQNARNVAISICLEASELLENFQWSGTDLECKDKEASIGEELADVMIYCLLLADRLGMDPVQLMHDKIQKNARKYPVDKARGSSKKYTEL